jgi:hypothetical protein
MASKKNIQYGLYGDEAPGLKQFIIVLVIALILMALSWVAYYEFKI